MRFWLGTHETSWLGRVDVDLFISRRRLDRRKSYPRALGAWALDSGGFTELAIHGGWTLDARGYAATVRRYRDEIGGLAWVAPQDWMCEPAMLARTGLSVPEHQARTVDNFGELRAELGPLVIPVLQGWTLGDYLRCVGRYAAAGADVTAEPLVGLGSVCRRQDTDEIAAIVCELTDIGVSCHGFGLKTAGLARVGPMLTSADSLAWSYGGRRRGTCSHRSRCANCLHWAMSWRADVLAGVGGRGWQPSLF